MPFACLQWTNTLIPLALCYVARNEWELRLERLHQSESASGLESIGELARDSIRVYWSELTCTSERTRGLAAHCWSH